MNMKDTTAMMKSSFDWEKISRTGQIGHTKPHKSAAEYERELREQRFPGMTDEEIRAAERQLAEEHALARRREQAEADAVLTHYAAAFAAGSPAECDYAVVKVDKCFGLSIAAQLATPNTGGVPGVCRTSHLGLENAHLPMVLKTEGEHKYLLLRSNVTNHNATRRQAFFDSVQRFFDYRRTTPQWTGGKAHELRLFPKHIPSYCRCRHCLRENARRMIARYNELNAQFPPLPPIEEQRRIYQEQVRRMQEYAQQHGRSER